MIDIFFKIILCRERERGPKQKTEFFKLHDRTLVDRPVNRHAQGLDRSTKRSTEVARGIGTQLGSVDTDISSKSCNARGPCAVDRAVDRTLGSVVDRPTIRSEL